MRHHFFLSLNTWEIWWFLELWMKTKYIYENYILVIKWPKVCCSLLITTDKSGKHRGSLLCTYHLTKILIYWKRHSFLKVLKQYLITFYILLKFDYHSLSKSLIFLYKIMKKAIGDLLKIRKNDLPLLVTTALFTLEMSSTSGYGK